MCENTAGRRGVLPSHRLLSCALKLIKLHRSILDRELNKTGVYRSQHQLLMAVSENPNASQKEIAEWMGLSAATIAVAMKKLERGGYISRIVDQIDNRFNQIRLTEKGRTVVEQSCRIFAGVEEQIFKDFTPEEFRVMEVLLERMYRNLSQLNSKTEREGL